MPRIRSDAIVIVDVESTCWSGDPPAGQRSEIIEIGACLLGNDLRIKDAMSMFVRPVSSTVSEFCTKLTGIEQADVEKGKSLGEACRELATAFECKTRGWGSYGDYDRHQFSRNCQSLGVAYPFSDRHLNIKWLLAMARGWDAEVGMDLALTRLGLILDGRHHRAGDDAKNIAKILATILSDCR